MYYTLTDLSEIPECCASQVNPEEQLSSASEACSEEEFQQQLDASPEETTRGVQAPV